MASTPDADTSAQLESLIARSCATKQFEAAASDTIEGFGPEILGYRTAMSRESLEAEDRWFGFAGFRRDSTMRTWADDLARNALVRQQRDPCARAE